MALSTPYVRLSLVHISTVSLLPGCLPASPIPAMTALAEVSAALDLIIPSRTLC